MEDPFVSPYVTDVRWVQPPPQPPPIVGAQLHERQRAEIGHPTPAITATPHTEIDHSFHSDYHAAYHQHVSGEAGSRQGTEGHTGAEHPPPRQVQLHRITSGPVAQRSPDDKMRDWRTMDPTAAPPRSSHDDFSDIRALNERMLRSYAARTVVHLSGREAKGVRK